MLLTVQQRLQMIGDTIRKVTAQQAAEERKAVDGVVIDVREPAECEADPVADSVAIPRGLLEMKALEMFPDPATPIYIHCASGARAQLAAEQLTKMGYNNVTAITCKLPDVKTALAK